MFRFILEFLALLMFFAVARAVIAAAGRLFTGGMPAPPSASPTHQGSSRDATMQSAGELRKDPVCGTFVPISTSLKRMVNGEAVYFCSTDCRDRFAVTSR
jgi:YHS domain-containing protein